MSLSRLLEIGLAMPPEERLAWVESLGEEHAAHKPRLRALMLRSCRADGDRFMRTLPKWSAQSESAPQPVQVENLGARSLTAGREVGPYRLLRCLGSGGMGVVWLASRGDGASPDLVALKFAHATAQSPDLAARLGRERQLLAALDHRNIARLYDAGVTASGETYLVLEYVEGDCLTDYVRAKRLSVRERLTLFWEICAAVAHAHERSIVHRDLKPSNVLVTGEGRVRLLDFGTGKLLSGGANQLQLSVAGQPLTPAYASPEQVRGESAELASDIYSLGVLLYELLTGMLPYEYDSDSLRDFRQAVLERIPRAPSRRAPEQGLVVELDAIALRALEKLPADRHPSVHHLARDIATWLLQG